MQRRLRSAVLGKQLTLIANPALQREYPLVAVLKHPPKQASSYTNVLAFCPTGVPVTIYKPQAICTWIAERDCPVSFDDVRFQPFIDGLDAALAEPVLRNPILGQGEAAYDAVAHYLSILSASTAFFQSAIGKACDTVRKHSLPAGEDGMQLLTFYRELDVRLERLHLRITEKQQFIAPLAQISSPEALTKAYVESQFAPQYAL